MSDETLWLVLPLPNRALSPNVRVNPFMKRAAARKQKRLTIEAIERIGCESFTWEQCEVWVDLYHRTERKRDEDNAVAMLKSMFDGIVEAGVVPDDTRENMIRHWPVHKVDKKEPRMEVVIRRTK